MTDPNCVINPRSGRAVKTSGKLGQKILKEQQNVNKKPHIMYKSANEVRPNRKDFNKKKELEKSKMVENKTNNLFVLKNTLKQIAKEHPTLKMDYWELLEPQEFFKKLNKIDNSITHKNVEYLFDTKRQDWGKFFEEIFLKDKKELEKPKTVEKTVWNPKTGLRNQYVEKMNDFNKRNTVVEMRKYIKTKNDVFDIATRFYNDFWFINKLRQQIELNEKGFTDRDTFNFMQKTENMAILKQYDKLTNKIKYFKNLMKIVKNKYSFTKDEFLEIRQEIIGL